MFKALFWNARGAGSDNFRSAIADLVKLHSIDVLAICEPRVQFSKACTTLNNLGFNNSRIVEALGFSGGLWLLWNKNKTQVDFIDDNFQPISVKITIPGSPAWMLSVIYASPTHTSRASLWPYFDNLAAITNLPWMLIGDFNELVSSLDKNCGPFTGRFGGLRNWINRNALIDMGFKGSCYTWSNNRVKERLDRAFCSCSWRFTFPDAFIQHLPKTRSDHCPILMQLCSNNPINRSSSPFRFQAMWFSHTNYSEFVSNSWNGLHGEFHSKIMCLSSAISKWNREVFGHLFQKKRRILARIGGIQKACDKHENPFLLRLEAELIHDYENILNQQNLFWKQKSRDKWLQGGDRNTKFFHLTTLLRRRKNKIEGLFDSNGTWFTDSASMKNIVVDFFTNLFSSQCDEGSRFVIPWLFPDIDHEDLTNIGKPMSLMEVKDSPS
ncbi:putative endonuclease/exonuclease/phosphatase [Rosa chinensis]|uniref:Putative endonuclease/exonuclease/phosphatase n=1 Tax=Rosa chinensis TaxID=74649 RepID=A0A2P6SE20_ROSCH|nr:putative endonuclease/exonuclease/phosphatase [Rosa chinensis]